MHSALAMGIIISIPYSGNLSRDKTFANFADLEPFVKVFSANFVGVATH